MHALELTGLLSLMAITSGIPDIVIGLIDGPVAMNHPDLTHENLRFISAETQSCISPDDIACRHGTFVAGILNAKRNSPAPAICPGCTLLVRPIFRESESGSGELPSTTPAELASAIIECIDHGARILNLSVALVAPSPEGDLKLKGALDYAMMRHVIVVAAAGNQGVIGASALTRHPWVIPVVACDHRGRPAAYSNISGLIGKRGLRAPGEKIASLGTDGECERFVGTSTAVPFVTGAIALIWSESPQLTAPEIKSAVTGGSMDQRRCLIPPLLNAWEAYQAIRIYETLNSEHKFETRNAELGTVFKRMKRFIQRVA